MFFLKRQLKKLKRQSTPSSVFKQALLRDILDEAPVPFAFPMRRFATIGLTAIVLFVTTGAGVYAYESPEVVEGHPLHFVKEGIEETEAKFAVSAGAKARFHAKMRDRRLKEAEHHAEQPEKMELILEHSAESLEKSVIELKAELANPETREAVVDVLIKQDDRYQKVFDRLEKKRERFEAKHRFLAEVKQIREEVQLLKLDKESTTEVMEVDMAEQKMEVEAEASIDLEKVDALEERRQLYERYLESREEIRDRYEEYRLEYRDIDDAEVKVESTIDLHIR